MDANPLVGTWRLVSFIVRDADGTVAYPFGQEAHGFITYTDEGRVAVQFGRADRAPVAAADWVSGTDAEIAQAARDYVAYCGAYETHDDTVLHRVELSLMPNWMGTEQVHHVVLDGDSVTLTTSPTPSANASRWRPWSGERCKPTGVWHPQAVERHVVERLETAPGRGNRYVEGCERRLKVGAPSCR